MAAILRIDGEASVIHLRPNSCRVATCHGRLHLGKRDGMMHCHALSVRLSKVPKRRSHPGFVQRLGRSRRWNGSSEAFGGCESIEVPVMKDSIDLDEKQPAAPPS